MNKLWWVVGSLSLLMTALVLVVATGADPLGITAFQTQNYAQFVTIKADAYGCPHTQNCGTPAKATSLLGKIGDISTWGC